MNTVYVIEAWEGYNSYEQAAKRGIRSYKECGPDKASIDKWIKFIKKQDFPYFSVYKVTSLYEIPTTVIMNLIQSDSEVIYCKLLFEVNTIKCQPRI